MLKTDTIDLAGLRDRASAYAASAMSRTTLTGYRGNWERFEQWCFAAGLEALPASDETVALFVTACIERGLTIPGNHQGRRAEAIHGAMDRSDSGYVEIGIATPIGVSAPIAENLLLHLGCDLGETYLVDPRRHSCIPVAICAAIDDQLAEESMLDDPESCYGWAEENLDPAKLAEAAAAIQVEIGWFPISPWRVPPGCPEGG